MSVQTNGLRVDGAVPGKALREGERSMVIVLGVSGAAGTEEVGQFDAEGARDGGVPVEARAALAALDLGELREVDARPLGELLKRQVARESGFTNRWPDLLGGFRHGLESYSNPLWKKSANRN